MNVKNGGAGSTTKCCRTFKGTGLGQPRRLGHPATLYTEAFGPAELGEAAGAIGRRSVLPGGGRFEIFFFQAELLATRQHPRQNQGRSGKQRVSGWPKSPSCVSNSRFRSTAMRFKPVASYLLTHR